MELAGFKGGGARADGRYLDNDQEGSAAHLAGACNVGVFLSPIRQTALLLLSNFMKVTGVRWNAVNKSKVWRYRLKTQSCRFGRRHTGKFDWQFKTTQFWVPKALKNCHIKCLTSSLTMTI